MKHILFLFTLLSYSITNTICQCSITNSAFISGEEIEYEVVYNWGLIWISAGKVSFAVKNSEYNGRTVYQIDAYGMTYKGYDWFFKVRDHFSAFVDSSTINPLWAQRNTSEGNYSAYENYVFDSSDKIVFMAVKSSKKPFYLDTLNYKGCIYDILSAAFHARNIDYSKMKINEKFPLWTLIDGKIYPIYIRYLGKELIEVENKKKYSCILLSSSMLEGTIFKNGEELKIWITDDKNHVPVLVEAKILVGSVKAILKKAENLRNPFTAKVN
jgi:hypothetical protein